MNVADAYAKRLDRILDLAVAGSDNALHTVYDLEIADLLKLAVTRLREAKKKAAEELQLHDGQITESKPLRKERP